MGRELIETEPLVQEKIKQCDELLKQYTDWSLWEELTAKEAESRIHETHISQPAIFALQVALASLWGSWGIKPDALTGHSVGEVAAAHVSGALNLEDAVLLIYHRSRLQARTTGQGKMLAAGLSEEKTKSMIASYREQVSIAAVNGPQSVTLAGNANALEEIANHLEREEVFWRFLKVDAPFHSSAMDQIKEELLESLSDLDPRPSTIPIYSTALGKAIEGSEMDASYWWQNVRNPVHFKAAIDQLIEKDHFVFIEISSHPVLAASIMECAEQFEAECLVLPSLRRQEPELPLLYGSLGALYTYGFSIEWHLLFSQGRRQVPLPAYPWQRERFWHETEEIIEERIKPNHPLLGKRVKSAYPTWNEVIDRRCLKYLDDHRIQGAVVYPAAAYVEMALSAAKETFGSNVCIIENIQFQKILFLADDEPPTVELILDRAQTAFEIYSKKPGANSQWIEILYTEKENVSALLPLNEIRQRCHKQTLKNDYYSQFLEFGLQYGPVFQGIEQLWSGANEALGQIHVHELLEADIEKYQLHPAILDACFQVLMGAVSMNESDTGRKNPVFLPVQIERIRVYGQLDLQVWSYARLTEQSETGLKGDIQITAEDGNVLAEIRGLSCKPVEGTHKGDTENIDQYLYQYRWKLQPRLESGTCFYPADYLPSPLEISTYLKPAAEQLSKQLSRNEYYEKIVPHSSELCALYVLNAFKQLGWTWELNQRISVEMLKKRLGVTDQNHRLIRRTLQMLEEDGILSPAGDQWEVVRLPEIIDPNEMWGSFIQKYPAYLAELFLLQRFGTNLTKILNGRIDPLTLIFSEGSTSITEHLYQDSPSNRVYNCLLQKTFTHILKYLPQGRTVRILEIGAGTGGATAYVLPTLPENSTEYVFTDISQQFMSAAEQKFKNFPFVQYRVLDIESEPIEQGYQEHSFDLILASNVLHATSDLRVTLENVIKLLAPQGMMVLIEVTQQPRTADLIFGSLKGWWLFTDLDLRPSHPLLSWPKWRDLLSDMGFSEVARLSDVQNDEEGELSVILAQCPESQPDSPGDSTFVPVLQEDPGKWLIFADHQGIAQQLAERFKDLEEMPILILPGRTYQEIDKEQFQIRPDHPDDMQQLIETVLDGELACRGIIHLWSIDAPSSEDTTISTLNSTGERVWYNVIYLIQALENVGLSNPLNLWLVSRGAQAVEDKSAISVEQTPLIGLRRVMINELQNIRTRLIDLSPEISPGEIQALFEELWLEDPEDEIALRGNLRYANRFMGVSLTDIKRCGKQKVSEKSRPDEDALTDICPFYLEIGSPGILDSLTFRETKRRKPRPGEVEIRVHATALNFKDVVKAMGLLTETSLEGTSSGKAIGLECAGTIVDVGENVKGLQVGDEVIAFSPNSFATYTTTPARFVRRKPDGLMLEEATTIPLVFITVYYALHHLARIQKGDKILIHAAAGGVGLAAIQLARHAGAEIFATAGTSEKREFLRAIGVGYVMDSRSLTFADQIMELTGGNGVDIVLNSLAGEALPKSLSILAPYGRFVELGKRDIDQNNKLGLKPFQNNLSFYSVDLDRLCAERPDYVESILEEVMALFENGTLHPLPYRIFPITDVVNAFRHMAQARHIGKVLVSLDSPEFITPHSEEPISFRQDGTYLITGGLGGFGLVVAKWLFENGAGQLVLIGRSGAAKPAVQEAVKSLQKAGMNLRVMKADVSREEDVARVLNEIHKSMPPLRGIIHAAMVLDDESLVKLDRERFHKVIAPKVLGAWNLHTQTLGDPLDYFIMFSSFTSLIGGSMQGNYAAANTFLDMLAHYRRTRNLPALRLWLSFFATERFKLRFFPAIYIDGQRFKKPGNYRASLTRSGK
jgi:NADPH:quinone reductase-like Zn-dependent oxidoreductase/malonyl CoA-acyl carrier protein transacylase/SAM-dependent methyltransferase